MADLEAFRQRITRYRKRKHNEAGRFYTQAARVLTMARAISLSPDELGHRLRGTGRVQLSQENALAIVSTLAAWEALTWEEGVELLTLINYPLDAPGWKTELRRYLPLPAQAVNEDTVPFALMPWKNTPQPQGSKEQSLQQALYLHHASETNDQLPRPLVMRNSHCSIFDPLKADAPPIL